MKSMTGFGRSVLERSGRKISLELKSVNHRYLDLNIRTPRALSQCEELVRNKIKQKLARGHVDVYIYYRNEREDAKEVKVDKALAKAYFEALKEIKTLTGAKNDITASKIAKMNEVLVISEKEEDENELNSVLSAALDEALEGLVNMREREGLALKADILGNIDALDEMLKEVEEKAPQVPKMYSEKLGQRVKEMLEGTGGVIDEPRMLGEIAMYCDKSSIAEEMSRLKSHLSEFRVKCEDTDAVGRSLDFMVQELNRETNTICSKANDIGITNTALGMKNAVEKIREQVQNIE